MLTVKQYQRNLKHYNGYFTGSVNGKKSVKLTTAVKEFQADHGLSDDGIYGSKSNAKLISVIKALQKKLGVEADGIIGDKTIAAIKEFQKKKGLSADGIAGPKTYAALGLKMQTVAKASTVAKAVDGKYSKNFKRSEFRCKCGRYCNGYPVEMSQKLIDILEALRAYYKKPITIRSGIRCTKHNANVGGVPNSTHKSGKAVDIYIPGICGTAAGRNKVKAKAYALGAKYSYCNTSGMGTSVHINV